MLKENDEDDADEELRCSFCCKAQGEVRKLIAGPLVFICDECVQICVDIIKDDDRFAKRQRAGGSPDVPPAPQHPPPLPGLMDHLAEISEEDQWLLVMHLLARLRDRHRSGS